MDTSRPDPPDEEQVRRLAARWILPSDRPWLRRLWQVTLRNRRQIFILLLGLVIFTTILLMPQPEGLSAGGQRALAVMALCALYWVTSVIPLAITGLLALALLSATQALPTSEVFAAFGNSAVFFILGALILAGALLRSGLSTRLALLFLRRFGHNQRALLLAILFGGAFLSFWMPEHAVAALLLPIVVEIAEALRLVPQQGRYGEGLFLALAWGTIIGGVSTFLGGARNVLAAAMLHQRYDLNISFFEWMLTVVPIVLILLGISALLTILVFNREKGADVGTAREVMEGRIARMGPVSRAEREVGIIMGLTILVWVIFNEQIDLATTALLAAVALFLLKVVDWKSVQGYVNWGIVLMYGGAIALGTSLMKTGATEWLAMSMMSHLEVSPWTAAMVLVVLAFVLTAVISNAAVVAMLLPVAFSLGEQFGLGPILVVYLIAVPSGLDFCLPIGTPPNAIAYASGYVRSETMIRVGLILSVVTWLVFVLMARFYWPLLGLWSP
ncbi:MAG: DASS family sodium-coupled anion symporter [Chloroflexia bacterium]|nr:DASS family sodium-coupled anion symporter [Chloroflexia bacterium]